MKKFRYPIIIILVILVAISIFCGENKTHWVNNAILALTAVIVLYYTIETSEMKLAVIKQNLLQTRPILKMEFQNPKVILKNEGKGPAVNGYVEKFKVQFLENDRLIEIMSDYDFSLFDFIPTNKSRELIMTKKDIESGKKGTVPEPDIFFQVGYTIYITLAYEDIEGNKYKTNMEVRSGVLQKISFNRFENLNLA